MEHSVKLQASPLRTSVSAITEKKEREGLEAVRIIPRLTLAAASMTV